MAGDWFKMIVDVADAFGMGDQVKGGFDAYLEGRSTETEDQRADAAPYVYERWLTRPRDPGINDR